MPPPESVTVPVGVVPPVAELATVTFGWVVLLQVGLLLIQRFHGGVQLGAGRWTAVVLILALQAYLILAPAADSATG